MLWKPSLSLLVRLHCSGLHREPGECCSALANRQIATSRSRCRCSSRLNRSLFHPRPHRFSRLTENRFSQARRISRIRFSLVADRLKISFELSSKRAASPLRAPSKDILTCVHFGQLSEDRTTRTRRSTRQEFSKCYPRRPTDYFNLQKTWLFRLST